MSGLTSAIGNSVTYKYLDGGNPNMWNTLNQYRHIGNFKTIGYCKRYNNGHVHYQQLISDSDADVTIKTYLDNVLFATDVISYSGNFGTSRYFFNKTTTFNSSYYDKTVSFIATQGTDTLTAEPIYVEDLTEDLANGRIVYVQYSNYGMTDTDTDNGFIDWESIPNTGHYMDFFIEAQTNELSISDETTILNGSDKKTIIAATTIGGALFKTGGIPDYMVLHLDAVSAFKSFFVNDKKYIKEKGADTSNLGLSTLHECEIELKDPSPIFSTTFSTGVSVDNADWVSRDSQSITANYTVEEPDGFRTICVLMEQNSESSASSNTVTIGYSAITSELGTKIVTSGATERFRLVPDTRNSTSTASTIYVVVTGDSGYKLDIKFIFAEEDI